MAEIVLTTFNARYTHASLGLRCLMAGLGPLQPRTQLVEFDLEKRPEEAVEAILATHPRIVGCGVYIWNTELVARTATLLKQLRPDIVLVLGGPEVERALDDHPLLHIADHLIAGEGEEAFCTLCMAILAGQRPTWKKQVAPPPPVESLQPPYGYYNASDLAHRHLYVEASRGCPYRCAFCLSALDSKVRPFPRQPFLNQMQELLDRGARHFKFVDRTFNHSESHAVAILDFFLERMQPGLFVHFEMTPERLSEPLRQRLAAFPAGTLQLEIGVQSFNPEVLQRIQRVQNNARVEENLTWLLTATQAHIHTDLIIGLPGESLTSFAAGFDRLFALGPHEIQVGILKHLVGTPLTDLIAAEAMQFNPQAPYELLANRQIDFFTLRRCKRFARYWDLAGNSGRFPRTLATAFANRSPFAVFMAWSDWLFATTHQTHHIALPRLARLLAEGLGQQADQDPTALQQATEADMQAINHNKTAPASPPPRQARHLTTKGE